MRVTLFLSALVTLQSTLVFAQDTTPACEGRIAVVRVSEILPNGAMNGFLAAVAAHKAWYRANGVNDNEIVASRVIIRDEKTGTQKYSDKEVITYHLNPPGRTRTPNRGDAAWNDYVKQYRENSEIKKEYVTCLPKFSQP